MLHIDLLNYFLEVFYVHCMFDYPHLTLQQPSVMWHVWLEAFLQTTWHEWQKFGPLLLDLFFTGLWFDLDWLENSFPSISTSKYRPVTSWTTARVRRSSTTMIPRGHSMTPSQRWPWDCRQSCPHKEFDYTKWPYVICIFQLQSVSYLSDSGVEKGKNNWALKMHDNSLVYDWSHELTCSKQFPEFSLVGVAASTPHDWLR